MKFFLAIGSKKKKFPLVYMCMPWIIERKRGNVHGGIRKLCIITNLQWIYSFQYWYFVCDKFKGLFSMRTKFRWVELRRFTRVSVCLKAQRALSGLQSTFLFPFLSRWWKNMRVLFGDEEEHREEDGGKN